MFDSEWDSGGARKGGLARAFRLCALSSSRVWRGQGRTRNVMEGSDNDRSDRESEGMAMRLVCSSDRGRMRRPSRRSVAPTPHHTTVSAPMGPPASRRNDGSLRIGRGGRERKNRGRAQRL